MPRSARPPSRQPRRRAVGCSGPAARSSSRADRRPGRRAAGSRPSRSAATRARSATAGSHRSSRGAAELDLSLHIEPFPARARRARLQQAARPLRVDAAARARARRPRRPRRRRRRRGRPRARRPARPRREPPLPRRPLPDRRGRERAELARGERSGCGRSAPPSSSAATPASFRALEGWLSSLPLGLDRLRLRRTFDSEALAASFPFAAAEPPLERRRLLLRARRLGRAGRLRPLRRRQLQQRHPRPLGRRQELPGKARGAAPALPGRPGLRRRPRGRVRAASAAPSAAPTCRSPAPARSRSTRSSSRRAARRARSPSGSPSSASSSS